MPDRWTAAARGRPLALVIKLHNCTDNESVCLRVKALGDTRRGSQPCWRRQERSEAAPPPSADGFRRRPFLFTHVTINQRNQFKFNHPPPSPAKKNNNNPSEFICLHSCVKKDETPQKAGGLIFGNEERTEKNGPVHFR